MHQRQKAIEQAALKLSLPSALIVRESGELTVVGASQTAGHPAIANVIGKEKHMSQELSRTAQIIQRLIDAKRRDNSRSLPKRADLRSNPKARGLCYVATSIRNPIVSSLEKQLEKWFGANFHFNHLINNSTVNQRAVEDFDALLRVRGYIAFNTEYLHILVDDLRRQCKDYREFDENVYVNDGIGILLDTVDQNWNRNGAPGILQRVAQLLRDRFGITIELMTEDEALEHMQAVLEEYVTLYDELLKKAAALKEAAGATDGN